MKKSVLLLSTAAMLIGATACGGGKKEAAPAENSEAAVEVATPEYKLMTKIKPRYT
jgi:ABC-type glycerol-3-phosphate transport system substrate-binding protein